MSGGAIDFLSKPVNDKDLFPQLCAEVSIWGLASNPFDCWLTERGLATLTIRMRAASSNAARNRYRSRGRSRVRIRNRWRA